VIQHHVSHQLSRRSSSGEKLKLSESLLGQVIEAVH
jgi:hypothetical protein